jgi:hypothetical protein
VQPLDYYSVTVTTLLVKALCHVLPGKVTGRVALDGVMVTLV